MSAALRCGLLLLAVRAAAGLAAEPDAAAACVYLRGEDGARYALAYAGRTCARQGYAPLPVEQYDAVSRWASISRGSGTLSRFDQYRILARLATLDDRSEHSQRRAHALFTRRSEYKWAERTYAAYAHIRVGLGSASPVTQSLETSLMRLRLATRKDDGRLEIKQRKLSAAEKTELLTLLSATEAAVPREDRMRVVLRSVEEAADSVEIRRQALSKFRLD